MQLTKKGQQNHMVPHLLMNLNFMKLILYNNDQSLYFVYWISSVLCFHFQTVLTHPASHWLKIFEMIPSCYHGSHRSTMVVASSLDMTSRSVNRPIPTGSGSLIRGMCGDIYCKYEIFRVEYFSCFFARLPSSWKFSSHEILIHTCMSLL